MSPEDMKQLNAIDTDIRNFVTKTQAKWITQGGVEAEWDDYLKQLDTLGLSKMLQIRQAGVRPAATRSSPDRDRER